jgi:hypothetical protein
LVDTVSDLPLELFELTSDGLEVESLTGAAAWQTDPHRLSHDPQCCCHALSTTCNWVSCVCFC